jgi:hypothetical protein
MENTAPPPPRGGGISAVVHIWGENMIGEEKKVQNVKEKGRKRKEKGKGNEMRKWEVKGLNTCTCKIGKNEGKKDMTGFKKRCMVRGEKIIFGKWGKISF